MPNAPIIFLANHPNAFLDAILIACSIKQKPWFLARGEVFKTKWLAWVLTKLRLIPIFRFRDGHGSLRRNEEIINRCAELLVRGESIILFPEGENSVDGMLLALQKGFVRISEAALKVKSNLNLQIVPIGIQYSSEAKGFGGTASANFGNPLNYSEFSKDKSTEQILNSIWENLNQLLSIKQDNVVSNNIKFLQQLNNFYFLINNFILKALIGFIVSFIKEEQIKNSFRFAVGMFLTLPIYFTHSLLIFRLTNSLIAATFYFTSLLISIKIKLSITK